MKYTGIYRDDADERELSEELIKRNTSLIADLRKEVEIRVKQIEVLADQAGLQVELTGIGLDRNPKLGDDEDDDYYDRRGEWCSSSARC